MIYLNSRPRGNSNNLQIITKRHNFTFKYNFFYSEIEDYIELNTYTVPIGIPFPPFVWDQQFQQFRNVKDATIHGHEVETSYSTEDFTLWGNYAYTHGQNDTSDEPLANIPSHTINYGVDLYLTDSITLGYAGQFVESQDRQPSGFDDSDSYNTHELYCRWAPVNNKLKGLAITLGVENLTDEEYTYGYNSFETEGIGQNFKATIGYTIQF